MSPRSRGLLPRGIALVWTRLGIPIRKSSDQCVRIKSLAPVFPRLSPFSLGRSTYEERRRGWGGGGGGKCRLYLRTLASLASTSSIGTGGNWRIRATHVLTPCKVSLLWLKERTTRHEHSFNIYTQAQTTLSTNGANQTQGHLLYVPT